MRGEVAYRQLVLRDDGEVLRLPLAAPVNDLIGQLRPTTEVGYLSWLVEKYKPLAGSGGLWSESAQAFLDAAGGAVKGKLSAGIAPHIERLRFADDGSVAVRDFEALAAWSLLESIRRQPLKLFTCPNCKGKWLGTPGGSRYCQRVAPGLSKDCRTVAYEKRVAGDKEYGRYRREYKKLTERMRRDDSAVTDVMHWRAENTPASWLPFDEWRARRAGKEEDDG
jgi:hypothetical protein